MTLTKQAGHRRRQPTTRGRDPAQGLYRARQEGEAGGGRLREASASVGASFGAKLCVHGKRPPPELADSRKKPGPRRRSSGSPPSRPRNAASSCRARVASAREVGAIGSAGIPVGLSWWRAGCSIHRYARCEAARSVAVTIRNIAVQWRCSPTRLCQRYITGRCSR